MDSSFGHRVTLEEMSIRDPAKNWPRGLFTFMRDDEAVSEKIDASLKDLIKALRKHAEAVGGSRVSLKKSQRAAAKLPSTASAYAVAVPPTLPPPPLSNAISSTTTANWSAIQKLSLPGRAISSTRASPLEQLRRVKPQQKTPAPHRRLLISCSRTRIRTSVRPRTRRYRCGTGGDCSSRVKLPERVIV
jgi:hypothetical protein